MNNIGVVQVSGNFTLDVNPEWNLLQLEILYLHCDTTLAPVNIQLFEISQLLRRWNVKILCVDISNNASVNNITILAGGSDTLGTSGQTSLLINENGSSATLTPVSETSWVYCQAGGGQTCDIVMTPQQITYGPLVSFTHSDFGSEVDIINPGVTEIFRAAAQGIYNMAQELGYQFGVSPLGTGWNANGWTDLTDVATRTYTDWRTCILNAFGTIPAQVGQELVMIDYFTNKYYKIKFLQWTQGGGGGFQYERQEFSVSEKCSITFSDGTKLNSASGLVQGSGVTEIVNLDGTITYQIAGSDINYGNVCFVDALYGNNATAQKSKFTKPFSNIGNAISSASVGASPSSPGLVYVRQGTYNSNISIPANVHVYCEPGVIFGGTCFVSLPVAGDYAKFFGFATIVKSFGWSFDISSFGGRVDIEFDSMDAAGMLSVNFSPIVKLKCNWARVSGFNGGAYCNRITDNADVTIDIREYFQGQYSLFVLRNGSQGVPFAGKLTVNCPLLEIIPFYTSNYGNFNSSIVQTSPAGGATVVINGELRISKSNPATPAFTFQNQYSAPTKVEVNGNIYAGNTHCIWTGYVGWFVDIRVNGDLISNISPINCYLNNTNVDPGPSYITVRDSKIIGYANILGVSRYIKFMNCSFYNYADGVTYPTAPNVTWQNDQLGQVKRADFYNCIAEANGASAEFMEFAGTGLTEITLVGCYGNKPVGTGLVPVFSDYVQVPGLKVLNRV